MYSWFFKDYITDCKEFIYNDFFDNYYDRFVNAVFSYEIF